MKLFVFAALIAAAHGLCPNKCSGHGTCHLGAKCACQPRWMGPDCSLRQCAYGLSWVTSADTSGAPSGTNGSTTTGVVSAQSVNSVEKVYLDQWSSDTSGAYNGMTIIFNTGKAAGQSAVIASYDSTEKSALLIGGFVEVPSAADSTNAVAGLTGTDRSSTGLLVAPTAGDAYTIQLLANQSDQGRHNYAECSAKGTCDRSSGECQCFPGYEGKGCRRQSCPGNCSGHGSCMYNHEVNSNYSPQSGDDSQSWCSDGSPSGATGMETSLEAQANCMRHSGARWYDNQERNSFISQHWDYNKSRQCVCDRGYSGLDCSSRLCPLGDDPLNTCDKVAGAGGEVDDIQLIRFAAPEDEASGENHFFTLTYTDMFNGKYTTAPIELFKATNQGGAVTKSNADTTAAAIKVALEALPNFAVPNVTVTPAEGCDVATHARGVTNKGNCANWDTSRQNAYYVTFVDEANSGKQNLLECDRNANLWDSDSIGKCTSTDTTKTLTADTYKSRAACEAFGGVWRGIVVDSVSSNFITLKSTSADPRDFFAADDAIYVGKAANNDVHITPDDGTSHRKGDCRIDTTVTGRVMTTDSCAAHHFAPGSEVYTVSGHYIGRISAVNADNADDTVAATALKFDQAPIAPPGGWDATTYLAYPARAVSTAGQYVGKVEEMTSVTITLKSGGDDPNNQAWAPKRNDVLVPGGHAQDDPAVQPRYKNAGATNRGSRVTCTATSERDTFYPSPAYDYKQRTVCSGRGTCDEGSGVCACFEGFTGEACSTQTVFF